jgi:hypothetical protein
MTVNDDRASGLPVLPVREHPPITDLDRAVLAHRYPPNRSDAAPIPLTLDIYAAIMSLQRAHMPPSGGRRHFQPGVRPACSIQSCSSGRCPSSTVVTLT